MIEFGVIKEYDGYCGIIISNNNIEYLLLKKEILYESPNIGDVVSFKSEIINTETEKKYIARFVKKKI